jgi:phosphatidylserine/phosphatidylglycerophosphate/cardiolipin synthase-like enzyme
MPPLPILASEFPTIVIPFLRETAKKSIKIIIFDWRWYPTVQGSTVSQFNSAIVECAKRGVEVKVLVNNDQVLDKLKIFGIQGRRLHSKKMLHTKMLLVDDRYLIIGSHNYTQHAFALNHEASILVDLETEQNRFVEYFAGLWGLN